MTSVGITGHQRLEDGVPRTGVANTIREELAGLAPPIVGLTSLAIGADQVFARCVLESGGGIHAVLPFADIERTFSPADVEAYRELIGRATVEVLSTCGTDEDAYLALRAKDC